MELLLWRWSTTAQITSALMIAVFFVVLARSVPRAELRPWVRAWLMNLAALMVTSVFWLAQPKSQAVFVTLRGGYFFTKTMFVVLLALGTWSFVVHRPSPRLMTRVVAGAAVFAAVSAFLFDSINLIGVVQSALIALLLGTAAVMLLVRRVAGSGWLAIGFTLRTLLAIVESLAYATLVFPGLREPSPAVGIFLASHSSFDTGAEWVIALGCVLMLHRTIQNELTQSNADLVAAKDELQQLVDRDPLTGLANRRALPSVLRQSFDTGATIMFFDLNDFKLINDSYGHQMGDDCLKRFAQGLKASFRPEDHIVRYAGDEFVVIAQGCEPAQVHERIDILRDRLVFGHGEALPIRFSVGQAYLPVHGDADAALEAADKAMYRDKAMKTRRMRIV